MKYEDSVGGENPHKNTNSVKETNPVLSANFDDTVKFAKVWVAQKYKFHYESKIR